MRQAITTKFLGPTNFRGARIVAKAQAGRRTVAWDDALDAQANHARAAEMLAKHYGWTGPWAGGASHDDTGYHFVSVVSGEWAAFFVEEVK